MAEKPIIKLQRAKVLTKTRFPVVELTVGLPNHGQGMMQGGTAIVIDINTGVKQCRIEEGQDVHLGPNNKIVSPECLGCIFHAMICLAVEL